MKKLYLGVLSTILLSQLKTYSQDVLWEKSLGGIHGEYLFDAQPTADEGFILAGSSLSGKNGNKQEQNIGDLDYFIWKMDQHGGLEWQKTYGGNGSDLLNRILNTKDGGFLLAGTSTSTKSGLKKDDGNGLEDFWLVKLNADGSEQWQKSIGGIGTDELRAVCEMHRGGYLLAGSSTSPKGKQKKSKNYGNRDFWMVAIDNAGKVLWDKSFGGIHLDEVEAVAKAPDNGFYIVGYSNSEVGGNKTSEPIGNGDYWILRLDKTGQLIWEKSFGGNGDDHPYAAIPLNDKHLLIGGVSNSTHSGNKQATNKKGTDYWLLKIDDSGTIVWEETYDIGEYDMLSSITENEDGSLLIGGFAKSERVGLRGSDSKGINDYVALKIDKNGKEQWRQEVGSNGDDILSRLIGTKDGGYLLAGTSNGKVSGERNSSQGREDFWIVKLLDRDKDEEDKGPALVSAVPNPTDAFTNIIINTEFENGSATLVDINGRILQTYELSSRTLPVDLRNLPAGVYIVNIKTNRGEEAVKILKTD